MGLFDFLKKKEAGCSCGGKCCAGANDSEKITSDIKILGSGCSKCNELKENTIKALEELSMDTSIEHISDFAKIASFGVMTTPAIVYKDKVLAYGKVLKTEEIVDLLQKEM